MACCGWIQAKKVLYCLPTLKSCKKRWNERYPVELPCQQTKFLFTFSVAHQKAACVTLRPNKNVLNAFRPHERKAMLFLAVFLPPVVCVCVCVCIASSDAFTCTRYEQHRDPLLKTLLHSAKCCQKLSRVPWKLTTASPLPAAVWLSADRDLTSHILVRAVCDLTWF